MNLGVFLICSCWKRCCQISGARLSGYTLSNPAWVILRAPKYLCHISGHFPFRPAGFDRLNTLKPSSNSVDHRRLASGCLFGHDTEVSTGQGATSERSNYRGPFIRLHSALSLISSCYRSSLSDLRVSLDMQNNRALMLRSARCPECQGKKKERNYRNEIMSLKIHRVPPPGLLQAYLPKLNSGASVQMRLTAEVSRHKGSSRDQIGMDEDTARVCNPAEPIRTSQHPPPHPPTLIGKTTRPTSSSANWSASGSLEPRRVVSKPAQQRLGSG